MTESAASEPAPALTHHFISSSSTLARCDRCLLLRRRYRNAFLYAEDADATWRIKPEDCFEIPVVTPWRERDIVMMDVETTGLDWTLDDITEIAFIVGRLERVDVEEERYRAVIVDRFHSICKPRDTLMARAAETARITGITLDLFEDAPRFEDVVPDITSLLDRYPDALLAAYNAKFDQPFVAGSFLRRGFEVPEILRSNKPLLDPCMWSRKIDKYQKGGNKLTVAALRHNIMTEEEAANAHRADFDAELTLHLLADFSGVLPERDHVKERRLPDEVEDLMDWQNAAAGGWMENLFGVFLPRVRREERIQRVRAEKRVKMLCSEGELDLEDLYR